MSESIQKISLFVTSIFKLNYNDGEEFKKEILPQIYKYESKNKMAVGYSETGYTSYNITHDILKEFENTNNFQRFVHSCVNSIHQSLNLPGEVICTNNWFNINRKYSYHPEHQHIPCVWSAVYYVNADKTADASLKFLAPWTDSQWPYYPVMKESADTSLECEITPSTGSLWVFPSYLKHAVTQQMSDTDRITIAMNFDYRK